MVPMIVLLFRYDARLAAGTSLAFIFPIALAGAILAGTRQHVLWRLAAVAVPFGLIGACVGVYASDAVSSLQLKRLFGILMLGVGLKMVFFPGGVLKSPVDEVRNPTEVTAEAPELESGRDNSPGNLP